MEKEYYAIVRESECEIIINKSRFIGRAFPIKDEKDALEKIQSIRERYLMLLTTAMHMSQRKQQYTEI